MSTPTLFRIDYDEVDGKLVRTVNSEIYAWLPVNTETGEVELEMLRKFDDQLTELDAPWQWVRFILTPSTQQ